MRAQAVYPHNPMSAIAIAPTNKLIKANACLPTPLFHKEGSIMKSPASISTEAAYMSMPAETAAMTPCVSFILAPSYEPVNKRNPATIPIGTVVANDIIINGRRVLELVGSVAIRVPRERPSNNWWNVTAVRREVNSDPDVIDRVRPITNECIMIPACKTKIPTICLRGDDAGLPGLTDSGCSLVSCEHPATVVESSSAES